MKVGDREQRTIYGLAVDLFGDNNPLKQAYLLDQARIVIKFHRLAGQRRGKSIVIVITMPNGCNIKSHCARDRRMAERYVRLWGLLEQDEGDGGAEPERAEELTATGLGVRSEASGRTRTNRHDFEAHRHSTRREIRAIWAALPPPQ
jgi:hypothetical protein